MQAACFYAWVELCSASIILRKAFCVCVCDSLALPVRLIVHLGWNKEPFEHEVLTLGHFGRGSETLLAVRGPRSARARARARGLR